MADLYKNILRNKDKITVVQSLPAWLPQTQTWIYNQIKHLSSIIEPHVVCGQIKNLDQFFLKNINAIPEKSLLKKYSNTQLKASEQRARLIWLFYNCLNLKPEIVHSHFGTTGWDDSLILRWQKVKHIITFYGYDVNRVPIQDPTWKERYKKLFQSAHIFLCEGPHMAECIMSLGCPQNKIIIHHLGVEVDRLAYKPRTWNPNQPLRILIAASFKEKKGIPYAIEAIGRLKNEFKIEVTIIGESNSEKSSKKEKEKILATIKKYNLQSKVRMIGFQPYSILLKLAYEHHIFMSPSITAKDGDTEGGAPVTIIEMAATGMPIISSTHCDIPEVITHGKTGLLANEKNTDEIILSLKWMIKNHESWKGFIETGYRKIKDEFDIKKQSEKLCKIYYNVLQ